MSLETFLNYCIDTSTKVFILDKIPLFLLVFAVIFLILMILLFSIIKLDNVALVAAPSFIMSVVLSYFIVRAFNPYIDISAMILASIIPLLAVALVVIMVAQILKFLW